MLLFLCYVKVLQTIKYRLRWWCWAKVVVIINSVFQTINGPQNRTTTNKHIMQQNFCHSCLSLLTLLLPIPVQDFSWEWSAERRACDHCIRQKSWVSWKHCFFLHLYTYISFTLIETRCVTGYGSLNSCAVTLTLVFFPSGAKACKTRSKLFLCYHSNTYFPSVRVKRRKNDHIEEDQDCNKLHQLLCYHSLLASSVTEEGIATLSLNTLKCRSLTTF